LTPTSGQASSFNLTAPTGWAITSVDSEPGVQLAPGSSTVIQGRGLTITSSSPLDVSFTAQAPCAAAANVAWTTVARTGGSFNGAAISVNDVPASVTDDTHCSAAFRFGRQPADAEFGANTTGPSQNITSVAYTANGLAIQAIVTDANGAPRPSTSVALAFATNPTNATLAGSTTAVSDSNGFATFDGTCATCSPITINKIGQGYKLKAMGAGVVGTPQPDAFGVYQEGEACATGSPCVVHGHNGNNSITTTVSALAGGDLGTFVSNTVDVLCAGYTPLTADSIVWKYTGGGSQTIVVDLSKKVIQQILDRGSDHLNFCFDSEGKPFTDKFGVAHQGNGDNGLLSDCNTGIDPNNCIVSETGLNGGGRRVTVIVADGRGKI
jgi:hypothetical protein